MKLCTAVQEGCGYKHTLRAHRYFAPSVKYFTVCITYQPPLVIGLIFFDATITTGAYMEIFNTILNQLDD